MLLESRLQTLISKLKSLKMNDPEGIKEKEKEDYPLKDRVFRVFYIILFLIIFGISRFLLGWIIFFQICFDLICAKPNERLKRFSLGFKEYISEVIAFATYQTNTKPFPFAKWPGE